MKYTLGEAAKAAKVHRSTIHRHIKDGRLSAERLEDNTYRVDASELARVFPVATSHDSAGDAASGTTQQFDTPPETPATATALEVEIMRWRTTAEGLEHQLQREREAVEHERETVDDLRKRLDRSEARVLALSAPPPPAASTRAQEPPSALPAGTEPPKAPRGFLARLLGLGTRP